MESYSLISRVNTDGDFYALMGRFFGSRAIAKTLGMPIYDDPGRVWFLMLASDGNPVACSNIEIHGRKGAMKSAWVEPAHRGHHLYDQLFAARIAYAREHRIAILTSTATRMSKSTHDRYGFQPVGMRGQYYLYRKDLLIS